MTIGLEGLQNFRDVGGMPLTDGGTVRSAVLYRSEGLSALTDAGVAALSASPIGVIADFRTPMEQRTAPDRLPADRVLRVVELSVLEGALTGAAKAAASDGSSTPDAAMIEQAIRQLPALGGLYESMLEHGAPAFAEAARLVAASSDDSPTAVLVHCTAGKDRTGVSIALLLDAVGVDRDAIIADYAASERNLAGPWAERMLAGIAQMGAPLTPEIRTLVTGTPRAAIEQAFAWLDAHGGAAAYLQSGGLTDDELATLRARLRA
ncbi:protein-tyrosine phosphatase [Microbacterium terrae]|uniref:Tyrosine-protein phosphatase n=1 Tax=Microbacterium terrae TaxID=69369 RepID=A0A0M2GVB1_9MICO|nr:tyrosine-protein phosphatase [Microbacterium terrae]KJL37442.1 Tyrosine-protein phosphatase precursor [Microbacterium terrae]MBP1076270.1 protein-tyrosine phosphatase [Microbacterium terrae]GLJ97092.1 phosphatase [Microbacterium terrae]